MFARLLPDAERVPQTRQEPARSPRRADGAETKPRAQNRPANKPQEARNKPEESEESSATESTREHEPSQAEETAAEPVEQQETAPASDTVAAVTGQNPSETLPAVDGLTPDVPPAVNVAAAEQPLTETPSDGTEASADSSGKAPSSNPQPAAAVPSPAAETTTAAEPVAATAAAGSEAGKATPQAHTTGGTEPDLPAGDIPANHPAAKTATAAQTDTPTDTSTDTLKEAPPPGVRSGKPTGEAPESSVPEGGDREPGNSTIDAPKVARPTPDPEHLGKPGVAGDAQAGKPGAGVDPGEQPAVPPEDAPDGLSRDNLIPLRRVGPHTTDTTGETGVEPADAEAAKAAEGEAKTGKSASGGEPATPRHDAEPARAPKPHTHVDIRPLIPAPSIAAEVRTTDIRLGQPIDLSALTPLSTSPTHTNTPVAFTPAQPAASAQPVPLDGIAIAIANNAQGGRTRFEIRLDPPELGRIDVRLHIDHKGHVTCHLIVDRAETLDLLRRDAADLERSLQQSGLKTSDNGMQFSLRDQSPNAHRNDDERPATAYTVVPDIEAAPTAAVRGYTRAGEGAGLDVRV